MQQLSLRFRRPLCRATLSPSRSPSSHDIQAWSLLIEGSETKSRTCVFLRGTQCHVTLDAPMKNGIFIGVSGTERTRSGNISTYEFLASRATSEREQRTRASEKERKKARPKIVHITSIFAAGRVIFPRYVLTCRVMITSYHLNRKSLLLR